MYSGINPSEPPPLKILLSLKSIIFGNGRKKSKICSEVLVNWAFPGGSDGKESTCNAKDLGSIPGLGRSPGGGRGNPTPVFLPGETPWMEEYMRAAVIGSQSRTRLND